MSNRRGRPPLDDRAALRRVAEYLVDAEQRGSPCSARAAILRTSGVRVGNSPDADQWRLQRKWSREGQALLAEARRSKATRHNTAMLGDFGREMRARTLNSDLVCAGMASVFERAVRMAHLHEEMVRGGSLAEMALRNAQLTARLNGMIRAEAAFAHAQNDFARTVLAEVEAMHALRRVQGFDRRRR